MYLQNLLYQSNLPFLVLFISFLGFVLPFDVISLLQSSITTHQPSLCCHCQIHCISLCYRSQNTIEHNCNCFLNNLRRKEKNYAIVLHYIYNIILFNYLDQCCLFFYRFILLSGIASFQFHELCLVFLISQVCQQQILFLFI